MGRVIYWKKIGKVEPEKHQPIFYVEKRWVETEQFNHLLYGGFMDEMYIEKGFYVGNKMAQESPGDNEVEIAYWFPMPRLKV